MENHKVYRFGKCRYEARRMILYRDDRKVPELQPLHRNLLVYFLEHPQTVISRQMLHEVGWGPVVVEKEALNRAISELRKRLGSPGRKSRYIRTVDGGGYEFIEEVEVEGDSEADTVNPVSTGRSVVNEDDVAIPVGHEDEAKDNLSAKPADDSPQVVKVAEPRLRTGRKKLTISILAAVFVFAAIGVMLAFRSRPTLESIEPSQPMSHIGDQPLLIRGKNLKSWLTVRVIFPTDPGKNEPSFGELPPAAITWHDKNMATCLIDFNSRPFPHGLQLRHPLGLHSNVFPVTVGELIQTPVIDQIAPKVVRPTDRIQLVIVYGAHFQQGPQVTLKFPDGRSNQLNPQSVERTSPGVVRLHVYLRQEGQYEIQVKNNNGRTSAPFNFTVTDR